MGKWSLFGVGFYLRFKSKYNMATEPWILIIFPRQTNVNSMSSCINA